MAEFNDEIDVRDLALGHDEPLERIARALEILALQKVAENLLVRAAWQEGRDYEYEATRLNRAAEYLARKISEELLLRLPVDDEGKD